MVASLFCMDKNDWDLEVVSDVLNERDQACVHVIPLSESNHDDKFYWYLEDSGIYSVKSAYRLLQTQKGAWNAQENERVWRILWNIKAPLKTLNLISLPDVQFQEIVCFKSWLVFIFATADERKYAEIITLCWSFVTPLQPHIEGDKASIWVKPQPNLVKVSVDAAVFDDRNGVGFGLVARNSDGELVEARALFHPSLVSPTVAEAMAFKEALSWMDRKGWHEAVIESDCLIVVQAIRSTLEETFNFRKSGIERHYFWGSTNVTQK
ncbi:uncharacterized protein LOC141679391 [Apium graveolens]|uniref:uncharacterized protein LOC141679391 n=1 Tax=Apium graveolens TaxID=4045 RepID=UPI003D797460